MSSPINASADERLLTDFTTTTADFGWFVVNDNVMGGRSDGGFALDEDKLVFAGRTNTRGGGFSSIRTRGPTLDLSGFNGVRLRVKGDGRRYTWQIRTDARFRGQDVSYWAEFDTRKDEWITVDLPFSGFVPKFRGFELDGAPPDPARIGGMGLMIYDGRDGPFAISVDRIEAYSDTSLFTLEQFRWNQRVLVLSAADESNTDLRRQTDAIAQSSDEFVSHDLILVRLLDSGRSAAGTQTLDEAGVRATRALLGIDSSDFSVILVGKDGSVKLRHNAPVAMSEIYALIDEMPMRRREMQHPATRDDA